jgi:hypothetical protein
MADAIEGFECFNRRVRQPLGFRLKQPARELVFHTDTGRADFSTAPLADAAPAQGRLMLGTVRSHDQWNTTIYSDGDYSLQSGQPLMKHVVIEVTPAKKRS